jgi:hypothetical protein
MKTDSRFFFEMMKMLLIVQMERHDLATECRSFQVLLFDREWRQRREADINRRATFDLQSQLF